MYASLMYRLWKILLSNMSRPETFGMALTKYELNNNAISLSILSEIATMFRE